MRVDCIEGVAPHRVDASRDDRGISIQIIQAGFPRIYAVNSEQLGTLRGLHHQQPGKEKIVVCLTGRIFDVVIDLRPRSNTYLQWTSFYLSLGDALHTPAGVAHGYITLATNTSLIYLLEGTKNDNCGLRWNDPKLAIDWPMEPAIISDRDQKWGLLP